MFADRNPSLTLVLNGVDFYKRLNLEKVKGVAGMDIRRKSYSHTMIVLFIYPAQSFSSKKHRS
jgi:hypothetical protein